MCNFVQGVDGRCTEISRGGGALISTAIRLCDQQEKDRSTIMSINLEKSGSGMVILWIWEQSVSKELRYQNSSETGLL